MARRVEGGVCWSHEYTRRVEGGAWRSHQHIMGGVLKAARGGIISILGRAGLGLTVCVRRRVFV